MVNHCANPICHKPLHYLREGKVFLFSRKNQQNSKSGLPHLEHFWLCGVCAKEWTLAVDEQDEVKLLEVRRPHFRARNLNEPIAQAS